MRGLATTLLGMNRLGATLRLLMGATGRVVPSSAGGEAAELLVLALGLALSSLEIALLPRFLYSAAGIVVVVAGLDRAAAFSVAL